MIDIMTGFILNQLQRCMIEKVKGKISKYGQEIFGYYCNHQYRQRISIRNFRAMPSKLYNALFVSCITNRFTLRKISSLFPHLKQLSWTNFDITEFMVNARDYVGSILRCISTEKINLMKITLQTQQDVDLKEHYLLHNIFRIHKNPKS